MRLPPLGIIIRRLIIAMAAVLILQVALAILMALVGFCLLLLGGLPGAS